MVRQCLRRRLRETSTLSISAIETILRYVYYVRNEDEWADVVDILRQSEPLIMETA
jgi:hypothetical protein